MGDGDHFQTVIPYECSWFIALFYTVRVECMRPFRIFVPPLVREACRESKCSLSGPAFLDHRNVLECAMDFSVVEEIVLLRRTTPTADQSGSRVTVLLRIRQIATILQDANSQIFIKNTYRIARSDAWDPREKSIPTEPVRRE